MLAGCTTVRPNPYVSEYGGRPDVYERIAKSTDCRWLEKAYVAAEEHEAFWIEHEDEVYRRDMARQYTGYLNAVVDRMITMDCAPPAHN